VVLIGVWFIFDAEATIEVENLGTVDRNAASGVWISTLCAAAWVIVLVPGWVRAASGRET
jgi:hypothetical protein